MQYSFYGGQQGKNFKIAKIFHNKVELMQDLMQRWYSSIGTGDLVLIAYGSPNDTKSSFYQKNADIDLNVYKKIYNVTLWQKIYTEKDAAEEQKALIQALDTKYPDKNKAYWDEYYSIVGFETQYIIYGLDALEQQRKDGIVTDEEYYTKFAEIVNKEYISEDFGLGYKLIASLAGSTPTMDIKYEVIDANENPRIEIDNTNVDQPILTFYLPKQQILDVKTPVTKLDSNQDPDVQIDKTDVNNPLFDFSLPQAQRILSDNVSKTVLDNDKNPDVTVDTSGTHPNGVKKINEPTVNFKLPQTQRIVKEHVSETVLDADGTPEVIFDSDRFKQDGTTINTNADGTLKVNQPSIEFKLPQGQVIKLGEVTVLDNDKDPNVEMDTTGTNTDGTKKINRPLIDFDLPRAQQLKKENVKTTLIDADGTPQVVFDSDRYQSDGTTLNKNPDGTLKVNFPSLEFKLPKNQVIALGTVTVLDADEDPTVILDKTDVNNVKLNIGLPRSQILQLNPSIVLPPRENPKSEYDDTTDINSPELTFSLPRAVRFMYGTRLGKRKENNGVYTEQIATAPELADLRIGDYYINDGTGFIYLVTAETIDSTGDIDRTFTYQACLAAPSPSVTSASIDTYKSENGAFVVQKPILDKSYSNSTEQIGLVLGFKLPRLPDLKGSVDFCGPDETGSITGKPTSTTEYTYEFTIPTGARFYCGIDVNEDTKLIAVVAGARPGDFYINGQYDHKDNGNIYKLGIDNIWTYQGNIKGKIGDALNIIDNFIVTPTEASTDTLGAVSTYLETQLGGKPSSSEIVAVTYRAPGTQGGTVDTAYWYYVVNNTWGRAQLTGATASLIENSYKAAGDTNKVYSVSYINSLLVALNTVLTADEKKIKTYSAEAIEGLVSWGSFDDLQ